MALDKPLPFETLEEEETETSRTYAIDWDNGRIIGFVDGIEAVNQFIKKALITPRFECLIYDSQYGSELRAKFLDQSVTREYIEAEESFFVTDALIHDERILRVYNIAIEFKDTYPLKGSAIITLDVDTIYGQISDKEVI